MLVQSRNIYSPISVRFLAGLLFCVLPLISGACKSDYQGSARQNRAGDKTARQVKVAPVEETPFGETVTANGTLAAFDQSTASVKVAGRLSSITVDLGSVVRRGQMIAQVEQTDYRLRVQQAEAALAQARARVGLSPDGKDDAVNPVATGTVRQARAVLDEAKVSRDRSASLVQQGIVARSEFDTVDAAYKVAVSRYQDAIEEIRNRQAVVAQRRSELSLARQQLADTAVYAPIDGIVQEKRASLGEYLAAGVPVVDIVRMNPLRLRAEVSERDSRMVRFGQNVRVSVEGDGKIYLGQIKRLSPVITQQNRMLMVEADVQNDGNLRPGSFAKAEIVTNDAKMAVTVPNNAIVTFAGIEKVIVVQNGKALEKPITTGRKSGEWTEILAGVNVGDQVIIDPGNLQSGMAVEIVQ